MSKTHPVSISCDGYGLAGNLVLPEAAAAQTPVPGAVLVGGPGPVPIARYSDTGAKQWPALWAEALGEAGVAALCYDQQGAGLSGGEYHLADWEALLEDNRAVTETLALQPEVGPVAAIAWAEGCGYALQLAAEGKVAALVLLAPPYYSAEERYSRDLSSLATRNGLSDRVVQIRVRQWRQELEASAERVRNGEVFTSTDLGGGNTVRVNLPRFVHVATFRAADLMESVTVPVLLLHGEDDTAISPQESEAMASALNGRSTRITYPGVAHFIYRHPQALRDATGWLRSTLC